MNTFINKNCLDGKKVRNDEIGIINCPVGYGKTYLATNELPQHFNSTFPIMAVPTRAIMWQTINDYENAIQLDKMEFVKADNEVNKMRVLCFSAIAQGLKDGNKITNSPDLLILDEIDELAKWSMCFDSYLLVGDWLITNRDKIKVIGLTATPQLLTDYVREIPFISVASDLEPKYKAQKVEVIQHSSIYTYLKTQEYSEDNKVLVYLQSAKQCAEMAKKYPDAGFIVSEYNEDVLKDGGKPLNELMKEQKINDGHSPHDNLRDYVLNEKKLPQGYNLLFFNDSCHTGMNIKDETVKTVICETVEQSAIIQAIGRVRHDLEKVVVITNYKNKKPFFRDLERARRFFNNPKFGDYGFLCGGYEEEQNRKLKVKKGKIDFDILTYCDGNGQIKINPFAKACYECIFDIYRKLDKSGTARQYFDETLKPLAMNTEIIYLDADEIKAKATNTQRFDESIIAEYLNRDLFSDDKKELVSRIKLVDKLRRVTSGTTLKKHLIEHGYSVRDSKKINPKTGKQERYSNITI